MPTGNKESSGAGWSDAERYKFLCEAIVQLEQDGNKKVDLKAVATKMEGRTVKSLSHMMARIRKDVAGFDAGTSSTTTRGGKASNTATSASVSSTRKRKLSDQNIEDEDEDVGKYSPPKTIKKARGKKAKASNTLVNNYNGTNFAPPPPPSLKDLKAKETEGDCTEPKPVPIATMDQVYEVLANARLAAAAADIHAQPKHDMFKPSIEGEMETNLDEV